MTKLSSTNMSTFIPVILFMITLFGPPPKLIGRHSKAELYQPNETSVCSKMHHPPDQKPTVILVHGFTDGGWCWYKLRWILESLGYTVMCPDLKASGIDLTHISKVDSFDDYNEPLDRLMASLPKDEKVVLVGHSAGGVSVTKTLHDYPEKVLVAIYVCATMLKHGYLTCKNLQDGVPHFSKTKCNASCPTLPKPTCFEKVLMPNSIVGPWRDQTEDTKLVISLARPGPYRALLTANFTSGGSSSIDKVPRVYVKTLFDKTLIPEQQDAMIKLWPPCIVHEIENDHNAPSVDPSTLAALIINATSYASAT